MAKIDTLFMTKTAEKPCTLGPHVTCIAHSIVHVKGVPPREQMKQHGTIINLIYNVNRSKKKLALLIQFEIA